MIALAAFLVTLPASAAGQQVRCPPSATALQGAAPILGPVTGSVPWGELHSTTVKEKDGAFINKYDLTGGDAPQLEKWMICYYRDGTHKAVKLPIGTRYCRVTARRATGDPATREPIYGVSKITCSQ